MKKIIAKVILVVFAIVLLVYFVCMFIYFPVGVAVLGATLLTAYIGFWAIMELDK